jgi:cytochrome c oxidase subunit IV
MAEGAEMPEGKTSSWAVVHQQGTDIWIKGDVFSLKNLGNSFYSYLYDYGTILEYMRRSVFICLMVK